MVFMKDICKSVIHVFTYMSDTSDYKDLEEIVNKYYFEKNISSNESFDSLIQNNSSLFNAIDENILTQNQRLLLATYFFLYYKIKNENGMINIKLNGFCTKFKVSETYISYVKEKYASDNVQTLLGDTPNLKSIVEPNQAITKWVMNLIAGYNLPQNEGSQKRPLSGLRSEAYEHAQDRAALEMLKGTPGLETLVKKLNEYGIEKLVKIQYTGSYVRVNQNNIPYLYDALRTVCETLEVEMPDLYIQQGFINAFTQGVEKPCIVITSGCLGLLSYDELLFVLGHEVGHIKSRHMLYHQMASLLPILGNIIGNATFGIGNLVSVSLQFALLDWYRKSEYTADRAGLLACQSIDCAITTMMKLAGYPPQFYSTMDANSFLEQAREFHDFDESNYNKLLKTMSNMLQTHPWTVLRASELDKWVTDGSYTSILKNELQGIVS